MLEFQLLKENMLAIWLLSEHVIILITVVLICSSLLDLKRDIFSWKSIENTEVN